jgi:hypothetical protein
LSITKVFFDTQICIRAASGRIPENEWARVTNHILSVAQYCISPLTLGEILLSIARGDEHYFESGKERLRRVYLNGKGTFFDFPRYFVADFLGLKDKRPGNLEKEFGFSVQVILLAQSRQELEKGVALPYLKGQVARVRLDRFLREIEATQKRYVDWFSRLRGKSKTTITPEQWAAPAMYLYGIEEDDVSKQRFIEALSASCQFDTALLDLARNENFDLRKNVSDLVDTQQLCYLCDPTVVFVTDDSDHRKRLCGNAQLSRIRTFADTLRRAENGDALL